MAIEQKTPKEAQDALATGRAATYLDVRTEAEFDAGHPDGSLNVPVVFFDPAGGPPRPNENFVRVVEAHLPKDALLVVGCKMGGRSQRACEMLEQAGYRALWNVRGGFDGARDRAGNVVAEGWREAGLPVEEGPSPGRSYTDLKTKA